MITFNADEIFEMAVQIEHNGAAFYRKAASFLPAARTILDKLAVMEDDHERTFSAMRSALTDQERTPLTADPDNQAAQYLKAMADARVFTADPKDVLSGKETLREVLLLAISKEKDSIVFYQSMKEVVPRSAGTGRIDDIIRQEIGHILQLTKEMPR
ncbi:MAG: ferritin family protein [Planctomycetota bacterium]|nr:ferritin family protein [Planctomycetota bacterium]